MAHGYSDTPALNVTTSKDEKEYWDGDEEHPAGCASCPPVVKYGCGIIGAIAVVVVAGMLYFLLGPMPKAGEFGVPPVTSWRPSGPRLAHPQDGVDYNIVPENDQMHTMHVGLDNDDTIWSASAPMFEFAWTAEHEMFVPEGPTLDNEGNLYFTPLSPREDVSLVSLDAATGARRWTKPGKGPAFGAVLILNDPENEGKQLIYHSTRETAYALRTDGSEVWQKPTGLPPAEAYNHSHMWGMNYVQAFDALIGLTLDGTVFAISRTTGDALAPSFKLPCAPAMGSDASRPPGWAMEMGDAETDSVFGKQPNGKSFFTSMIDVIFGGGACVSNYYAVDINTGKLYIAATASDEHDGNPDGFAEDGALYVLQLESAPSEALPLQFALLNASFFEGGTGSTPSVSADSKKVLVSDDQSNVIAMDADDLSILWTVNVGEQVAASIAVAPNNDEFYAVTKTHIIKIRELPGGNSAEEVWRADLSTAFPGATNVNALTPTITANGIAISVGAVVVIGNAQLMTNVGIGLLDRETGKLRYFAEGREESIAVTVVGADGSYYTANSPVRRAISRQIWRGLPPLIGGITRYRPIRLELLARDASCAAAHLADNAGKDSIPERSAREDARQVAVLVRQVQTMMNDGEQDWYNSYPALAGHMQAADAALAGVANGAGEVMRSSATHLNAACMLLSGESVAEAQHAEMEMI